MIITSSANPNIKALRALYRDKKNRYEVGEYPVEGATIVRDIPKEIISRVFIRQSDEERLKKIAGKKPAIIVKDEIFDSVADTQSPSGIIAVATMPKPRTVAGDMVIVLCGVSDAGNVGTIIRTACAKGVDSVILIDTADPYSPKAVRASMGGIFKMNVVQCDKTAAFDMLTGYRTVVLDMAGNSIYGYKQEGKIALVIGNEAHGVPDEIKLKADITLSIPMKEAGVESLNAAVAAGIAMYLIK